MTAFRIIIPARYGASRLPGKPLLALAGRPVIEHVYDRAVQTGAEQVIVATDDPRIADVAEGFGATVSMTRSDHASGTDRLVEVVDGLDLPADAVIVNLQGDEPLMPPALVVQVAGLLAASPRAAMATLSTPLRDADEWHDPHVVKVVTDHQGRALYFSRAPIPWDRAGAGGEAVALARRHIGLYAYRAGFLRDYPQLPVSRLEQLEQLEQLRALEAGVTIQVADAIEVPGPGIDTAEDLLAAEARLSEEGA
jgi:3-deoxy-manno-octulosonate cytidylyltransferase (CMP-KDO synthetase)